MKKSVTMKIALFVLITVSFTKASICQVNWLTNDFPLKPSLAWAFQTAKPIFSSPVISNNTIYFGGLDSNWYAVDLQSGQLKWKFVTKGEIRSTAAIHEDQVVFLSGDGNIYALNKNNGRLIWSFQTAGEKTYPLYGYADYYHSSPVINNSLVYVGSGDSYVYAIDANSGKLRWKFKTGDIVHATPAVHNGQVYVGSFDGFVYALDANNGKLLWKFKSVGQHYFPRGEMQGNPIIYDNKVFIGSRDYNLYALDAQKGFGHWNRTFPKGWAMGTPVVKDSVLYVGTSDDMVLLALDPVTGQTKWQAAVKFNVFGGSAFTDSMVYIGTLMGKLFGIDRRTGTIKWTYETKAYLGNRSKYFNETDDYRNDIQQVIRKGEDFVTMYYELGAFFSTPAIANDQLVITSTDGTLYCFRLQ